MAATAGSPYQALRLEHIAGRPPNSDPQRASEGFSTYVARMAALYLNPDINADESDSDYLARLSSYTNTQIKLSASEYRINSGFINYYNGNITASSADNGHCICMQTGSLVYLTGSLSDTFTATLIQSGSTAIKITGSDAGVIIRNRQSQYSTAGQYGVISIVRVADGSYIIGGDTA